MTLMKGKRVVITGASGLVALPVVRELAKTNEVYAVARFSDPKQKRLCEEAGAKVVVYDMADPDMSPLPKSADIVINYGVLPPGHPQIYEVNTGGTGRLASRYRDCEAFVHGSTASVYQYQGERALKETDQLGLHRGTEPYSASKIGAEYLLKQFSLDFGTPIVMVRIFSFYGPRGGGPTERIHKIANGEPVSVYPGAANIYTPMYEDDYVEKTIQAASIAKSPAEVINLAGTEAITIPEYCEIAAEMLGKPVTYVENGVATPIWGDSTRMVAKLGPCHVSMREGIRRIIEGGVQAPLTQHAQVGQPK